jgi:hypothetical protein
VIVPASKPGGAVAFDKMIDWRTEQLPREISPPPFVASAPVETTKLAAAPAVTGCPGEIDSVICKDPK